MAETQEITKLKLELRQKESAEIILKEKIRHLNDRLSHFKERYHALSAKRKYIDQHRDSPEPDVPFLELERFSSEQDLEQANRDNARHLAEIALLNKKVRELESANTVLSKRCESMRMQMVSADRDHAAEVNMLRQQSSNLERQRVELVQQYSSVHE